jgi:hypothetical protein
MTIDPLRRRELIDRYGIDNPPMDPALNATVQAILDSEQIVGRQGWARRIGAWVDPTQSPRMYALVTKARCELRAAMARGEIEFDDFAAEGYAYDPDNPGDAAVLIHFVGSRRVGVCKRPTPGRVDRGVGYHSGRLQLATATSRSSRRSA